MKKVLLIALAVLLLPVLGTLGVGVLVPRFEYSNSVEVDRPVDEVWAVFTDAERMDEWMLNFVEIECLEGEPLQVGSRWRLVFDEDGERISVDETVTKVVPGKEYAFDLETEPFTGSTAIVLEATESGTRLTASNTVEGRNVAYAGVMRMMKGMMESRSQESYEALAALCERSERGN